MYLTQIKDQIGDGGAGGGGGGTIMGTIDIGQNAFGTALDTIGGDNQHWWDNATKRFGVGRNFSATAPESVFTSAGSVSFQKITTTAIDYAVLASDHYIGTVPVPPIAITITLPAANGVDIQAGKEYIIKDQVGGAGVGTEVTITAQPGEAIDGLLTFVISLAYGGVRLKSLGGSQWAVVGIA